MTAAARIQATRQTLRGVVAVRPRRLRRAAKRAHGAQLQRLVLRTLVGARALGHAALGRERERVKGVIRSDFGDSRSAAGRAARCRHVAQQCTHWCSKHYLRQLHPQQRAGAAAGCSCTTVAGPTAASSGAVPRHAPDCERERCELRRGRGCVGRTWRCSAVNSVAVAAKYLLTVEYLGHAFRRAAPLQPTACLIYLITGAPWGARTPCRARSRCAYYEPESDRAIPPQ